MYRVMALILVFMLGFMLSYTSEASDERVNTNTTVQSNKDLRQIKNSNTKSNTYMQPSGIGVSVPSSDTSDPTMSVSPDNNFISSKIDPCYQYQPPPRGKALNKNYADEDTVPVYLECPKAVYDEGQVTKIHNYFEDPITLHVIYTPEVHIYGVAPSDQVSFVCSILKNESGQREYSVLIYSKGDSSKIEKYTILRPSFPKILIDRPPVQFGWDPNCSQ